MDQDSIRYDSLAARPLPKWLTSQRDGLNTIQPQKIVMKEDNSLRISIIATGIIILLVISVLTVYFLKRLRSGRFKIE